MRTFVSIGIRNVLLHWRHSLAAVLTVATAFFSINVFQGYLDDLKNLYLVSFRNRTMYGDIMVTHKDFESDEAKSDVTKYLVSLDAQNAIREFAANHADAVEAVTRSMYLEGTITNGSTSAIFFGVGVELGEAAKVRGPIWAWNAMYGEPLDHYPEGGRVLLGQALGRTLDCWPDPVVRARTNLGGYVPEIRKFKCGTNSVQLSSLTGSGQVSAVDLEVVGIEDAGYVEIDKKFVMISLKDAQTLYGTDGVTYTSMLLRDPSRYEEIRSLFNEEVGSKFPSVFAGNWKDHPRLTGLYKQTMAFLGIFRNFVVIVILVISALSVIITMTKSLSERTKEIGTLLSLGFRPWHVRTIFFVESIFLCVIGVAIGGVASFSVATFVNTVGVFYKGGMLSEPVPFRIMLGVPLFAGSCIGLIALGVIATAIACERVLKKKIVDCLRHA